MMVLLIILALTLSAPGALVRRSDKLCCSLSQLSSPLQQTLQVDGDGVWPGQLAVLLPPPLHHEGDVETQQEGDGQTCRLFPAPSDQLLKVDLLLLLQTEPANVFITGNVQVGGLSIPVYH